MTCWATDYLHLSLQNRPSVESPLAKADDGEEVVEEDVAKKVAGVDGAGVADGPNRPVGGRGEEEEDIRCHEVGAVNVEGAADVGVDEACQGPAVGCTAGERILHNPYESKGQVRNDGPVRERGPAAMDTGRPEGGFDKHTGKVGEGSGPFSKRRENAVKRENSQLTGGGRVSRGKGMLGAMRLRL
jgi:hypothetical protein